MLDETAILEFVDYVSTLAGDEKGEAQLFCDRLFRAFGHGGIIEANGSLETRIKFSSGKTKFADCLWSPNGRSGVLIEMKKKKFKNLEDAFPQARDYWIEMNPEVAIGSGAQKPEYIVLCNFENFLIYKQLTLVDEVRVSELPDRFSALNFLLAEEKVPIFKNNVKAISEDAARTVGELFKYLIFDKRESREDAQRFLLQCVLSFFSEDFGLLPHYFFAEIIRKCQEGESSYDLIGGLFRQMANPKPAKAGMFKDIKYFNGGLFDHVEPIELDDYALELLYQASTFNWKNVNPAIFGSLFEGTMNAEERHAFGAHFTSEVDIQKIVYPTIIKPWKARIDKTTTLSELKKLHEALGNFIVLDPSCGCGNFLFVSFIALKEIEMQIIEKMAYSFTKSSLASLNLGISRVSSKQFYGIDVLPIAVEVAKTTMMLAKELAADKWNSRIGGLMGTLGLSFDEGLPLDNLDECIYQSDAILEPWPKFDVVIGNPPYQSKNKMQAEMDPVYIDTIREAYPDVPGRADFCVYWFRKAHELMCEGQRAGLVGTNTIRQNFSREGGLDYVVQNGGTITNAVSTQTWSGDAAVEVSIVNWIKGSEKGKKKLTIQDGYGKNSKFNYLDVPVISSALSPGIDVTEAKALDANKYSKLCYQGQTHGHKSFLVTKEVAQSWIKSDSKYCEITFPFLTTNELLGTPDSRPKRYVIDFRKQDAFDISSYEFAYSQIKETVLIEREDKAEEEAKKNKKTLEAKPNARVNWHHRNFLNSWWKMSYPRYELMDTLEGITRYIACGRVTKRPIFEFISSSIHPNDSVVVFPCTDDYSFGIFQSSLHWEWFKARCSTHNGRPRYTSDTVFDSFPWPQSPTKASVINVANCARNLRSKRREIMNDKGWSLRDLYRAMEESPNNPVSKAQDELDKAVLSAYGAKGKVDILKYLLELNNSLFDLEEDRKPILGPGLPEKYIGLNDLYSSDCISM
ncbi:DNA methyltransferase [Vreelandella venusta]|uniref:DNA methyltransferase n=1 Tax=Vreelandella venusta TaxID=44935 RepID=UPI0018DA4B5F|nr:DNA methyltransferase [Halomonas venusta]QPI65057.1 class I SAM-dependent DNA methyltransferase [Halomonas venusta]